MHWTLRFAAIYNLLWGAWVILLPQQSLDIMGYDSATGVTRTIWQGMGMVIGVYGLGYYWASFNPVKHWPIVAVGMLGKLLGPIGFLMNYLQGLVPADMIYLLVFNDFIWWIPFSMILIKAHKASWPLS
jgi:hypothetical protein